MRVGVLFPGQGSQQLGMCRGLIAASERTAALFRTADEVLGLPLTKLILEGSMADLTPSEIAQPAVVTASYAFYQSFVEETGLVPSVGGGHSLGEITALVASGALAFEDAVAFAHRRGAIMHTAFLEKKGRCGLVLEMKGSLLETLVAEVRAEVGFVAISGHNSPRQFIVAGTVTALKALEKRVYGQGGEFVPFSMMPMKVDAPYHSELMSFIVPSITAELAQLSPSKFTWEVISTVTGRAYAGPEEIPQILQDQLERPVLWCQTLEAMAARGVDLLVDIGPQDTIRNLSVESLPGLPCTAFDSPGFSLKPAPQAGQQNTLELMR